MGWRCIYCESINDDDNSFVCEVCGRDRLSSFRKEQEIIADEYERKATAAEKRAEEAERRAKEAEERFKEAERSVKVDEVESTRKYRSTDEYSRKEVDAAVLRAIEAEAAREKAKDDASKKVAVSEKRALEAERRAKEAERKAKEAEAARVKAEAIAQEKAAVEARKKKIKQIVVAVAVLLVCISLIIYLMTKPSVNPTLPTPNPKVKEKTVEVPVEKVVEKPKVERKTQAPKANNNDIKLDYGVWESSKSPNKINGRGKLTYTKSAPIKGWPGKVAQPGDYIEGRFENGKPVNANWYDKNGNKKDYLGGSSE